MHGPRRILSCVPQQLTDKDEKLDWLDTAMARHRPHIVVTPQEFFGGAVQMLHNRDHRFEDLFPTLQKLVLKHKCALAVGVQQRMDDKTNREAIWFINEKGKFQGSLFKFALPKYDHVATNGFGDVVPETDMMNRFKLFKMQGMLVSGVFCWEVYSDLLWTGLGLLKPDVVFSMIKFGPNAWPKVRKRKGKATVVDFGYGTWAEGGGWIERLHVASKWQVKCPIVNSTNSWGLRPISMPICGTICEIPGQADHTLWHPTKEDKLKSVPEKIVVDEIDPARVQYALQNKFTYKDAVGDFPPFDLGRFTMMLKINRIEDRMLSGREAAVTDKAVAKRRGGFGL